MGSQVVAWVSYLSVKQQNKGEVGLQGAEEGYALKTWLPG